MHDSPSSNQPVKKPKISITPLKKRKKRLKVKVGAVEIWDQGNAYCKFCRTSLNTEIGENIQKSHLLYECPAFECSAKGCKNSKIWHKNLMQRLAEIGEHPEPGGDDWF